MARDYAELNTNLDSNQATVVPSLNGRQGDANREVYFWLKDGKTGVNLQGKTITLFAKDASGVVKTASTMNDTTGLSAGRFSLIIPAEFYQAEGTVQDSYLQVKNGDAVITTIPVSFQVLENTMLVTQTQSQLFLDTVQSTIDDFNSRIATTTTNLTTVENAQKALQVSIDNINSQFNSELFAQKAKDNEFKGNNTFDGTATFQQKIVAMNGVQGKADSAGQADNATNAVNATNATNANHASVADSLTASNNQTVNNLTVNGQLVINPNQSVHITSTTDAFGLNTVIRRINNMVYIVVFGSAQHTSPHTWVGTVPAGYRPVDTHYFTAESQSDRMIPMSIATNGNIYISSMGTSDGNTHGLFSSFTYMTLDSAPSN